MDIEGTVVLDAAPDRVFTEVADLATYPHWLGIVHDAVSVPAHDQDPGPAWSVELGARLGPLRRTKRVRMVRTEQVVPELVRFERSEHDGRDHSPWVLTAEVGPDGTGSVLVVRLHYGGSGRVPGIEALLREEIRKAGSRLQLRLTTPA